MRKTTKIFTTLLIISAFLIQGCGNATNEEVYPEMKEDIGEINQEFDFSVDYDGIARTKFDLLSVAVHDPSVVKGDDEYYIFGSHLSAAKSSNLSDWEMMTSIKNSYSINNPVYTDMQNLDSGEFSFTGNGASTIPTDDKGTHIWAPDVVFNKAKGQYYMYYCTSSTFNASTIVYGVSDNIEGPYEWKGNLLYSGETVNNIEETDILDYVDYDAAIEKYTSRAGFEYNYNEYPNCIDPHVFYDENGRLWMVYGSWSGGIFLIEIDEETGLVIHPAEDVKNNVDTYYGKRLMGGGHHSIEGPYILYDEESGYYYLYVSYGELKRDGGYQIRVFRSETVDGDYVDMNGAAPDAKSAHNFYGLKLSGNYYLPSLEVGYKATGHNSAFIDTDGKKYIVYHTRYDKASESHTPRAKQYLLNAEKWPCMLPYATSGEQASESGYDKNMVVGRYYCVNQGTGIDSVVAAPFIVYLMEDGSAVSEDFVGSWTQKDGSYYMTVEYNEKVYSGVFCAMKDEAGTDVMTFSAVGENESFWGVKY